MFFCLITFAAESGLPGIHKTASSSKVKKETDITSSAGSSSSQTTSLAVLPDGKAYIGVNSYLSLRDEPFGKVCARLYNNEEVVIVNRDGDWYEVETDEGSGWIYGKCVFDSPNSNSNGSASEAITNNDIDDDDDEDDEVNQGNGKYYYFTFDNPGDYKLTFTSVTDDEENDSGDDNAKQQNLTNDKNTKTKPAKKTDSKKTKKSKKTKTAKSTKSNDNDKNIDKNSNDHLKAAELWTPKVFGEILKYKCLHKSPYASKFKDIKKKRRICCTKSSSIVFQMAGIIPKGKTVGHTPNGRRGHSNESFDTALKKSVYNANLLIKGTCDIVMVMKKYKECPDWLRQKGIYLIQESNACICLGQK